MVKSNQNVTMPSGDPVSMNGFGTWKAEPGRCAVGLRAALEVGYRHIDLAAVYMNEPELGLVFEEYCSGPNPKIPREQLFITSKVWNTCHAREHVMDAIKQSLLDLRLTYLDLYLIHHPFAWEYTGTFCHLGVFFIRLSFVFLLSTPSILWSTTNTSERNSCLQNFAKNTD
jgi:alcohol dehydrogenase (NADP+)